ncbi:MAG: hypothetical protein IJ599_04185 [Alphaproteobacteria bacterium]|nr:hypothetical protein [Alphaproteobacteria bacterium]
MDVNSEFTLCVVLQHFGQEVEGKGFINYCFFQKGQLEKPDLPSCSQACRAEPGKQAGRRSVA